MVDYLGEEGAFMAMNRHFLNDSIVTSQILAVHRHTALRDKVTKSVAPLPKLKRGVQSVPKNI